MKKSLLDRIFEKTELLTESGCWIFTGASTKHGYGIIGLGSREDGIDRVHRIMYRHFVGIIPDGMYVCHRCDVPACCNPNHLFVGTAMDNHRDMTSKNRGSIPPVNIHDVGSYRYNSKLTESIVILRRNEWRLGKKTAYRIWKEIDAEIGIGRHAVERMLKGITWRHVKC